MTFKELKELEQRLLYKGRKCFRVLTHEINPIRSLPHQFFNIEIIVHSPDTDDIRQTVRIGSQNITSLSSINKMTIGSFTNWVRETITSLEVHEVSELLKLDGKRVFHPHKLPVAFKREEVA